MANAALLLSAYVWLSNSQALLGLAAVSGLMSEESL